MGLFKHEQHFPYGSCVTIPFIFLQQRKNSPYLRNPGGIVENPSSFRLEQHFWWESGSEIFHISREKKPRISRTRKRSSFTDYDWTGIVGDGDRCSSSTHILQQELLSQRGP